MNKDLDERLLPQGEYRDALDIDVSYSEGSDVGTLQNILGNTQLDSISLSGAACVGSVTDTENSKIYWFITSSTKDIIAEFNGSSVKPILVDVHNGSNKKLNFSTNKDNFITGVNVLDEVLYFTDNLNEPKQVDINYWRTKSNNNFNASTADLSEDRITVIKKAPVAGPRFHELEPSLRGGNGTIGGNVVQVSLNLSSQDIGDTVNIYDSQYKASDGTSSIAPNWQVNDVVEFKNSFTDDFGIDREAVVRMKMTVNGTTSTPDSWEVLTKTSEIKNANVFYTTVLEEEEALFQLKFPRFAYRYKYTNGQYSKMSPFGQVAFIPGDYNYSAKEGFNTGMVNTVRKLTLRWFTDVAFGTLSNNLVTPATNNYAADVEEVEILYKDSVSPNIYIVDGIKKDSNGKFPNLFEVKDEQIFKVIESNQLLRSFDSVPRKAKSQEIVGNRIVYGNYLHNFNFTSNPTFNVSTINYIDGFGQNKSIKSGRTYQIGITFQDEYGRETPVFTDNSGIIKIPYRNAELKQKFRVNTTVTPPTEATHFKYYIKEVSNPYHNIAASNIYEETDTGHLYLSFPSSEVNKVSENDILIFKKGSANLPYKLDNNKFKVLSKLSDPPDFLANKEEVTYATDYLTFGQGYASANEQTIKKPGITPVPGHNTIFLAEAGRLIDDSSPNEVDSVFVANINVGSEIRFRRSGTTLKSDIYKVKALAFDPDGDREVQIDFETQFGDDVNVIYDTLSNTSGYAATIERVERKSDLGNPEYDGKFFIKLNSDPQLKQGLLESIDESTLNTIATHPEINMTEKFVADSDLREYFISHKAANGGSLGQITTISQETLGTAIPSGFHLVLVTENNYGANRDKYASEPFGQGLVKGNFLRFSQFSSQTNTNFKIDEVQTGFLPSSNQKFYAIKLTSPLDNGLSTISSSHSPITIDVRAFTIDKSATFSNPPVFEIEPEDGVLDIYYEDFQAFPIAQLGSSYNQDLDFSNCFTFGNGVESDRIRDDFNAPTLGKGVRVSTVFEDNYQEERLKTGLIYSGIYNSKSGINRLNQFIIGEKITKDLNPEYGSIQLLHTRDTDIVAFCENNLVKIFANKDAVFNADGNPNLIATNRVLGQAVIPPTFGAYGISKNPESFAAHTYRAYFTDKNRGKVLRLSIDGVTEISAYGMKDYFKDKLSVNEGLIVGSFDENKNLYNITFTDDSQYDDNNISYDTVSFSESVSGWPSRKSFLPESAVSVKNKYYSFKNGHIYGHGETTTRNKFYGATTATYSHVTSFLNANPGSVKNFRTLNYQGDTGWGINSIKTNKQNGQISSFVEKEGIYYNYISGEDQNTKAELDLKSLNVQGLGTPTNINGNNATFTNLNAAIQVGDKVYNNNNNTVRTVQSISGNTITLDGAPVNSFNYFAKNNKYNTSGLLGYYLETTIRTNSTEAKELYSIGSEVSLSS